MKDLDDTYFIIQKFTSSNISSNVRYYGVKEIKITHTRITEYICEEMIGNEIYKDNRTGIGDYINIGKKYNNTEDQTVYSTVALRFYDIEYVRTSVYSYVIGKSVTLEFYNTPFTKKFFTIYYYED